MGDLLLTFPLLLRLRRLYPGHPLWVVAEPQFFKPLMAVAPEAVFFPPAHCTVLARGRYAAAFNLCSAPAAARCMAALRAERKIGPVSDKKGLHVRGFWQLYRTALTQNNHNNPFHWADLHLLDLAPYPDLRNVPCAALRRGGARRVGLVLGASTPAKRPDADFWARLARRLAAAGAPPLLLGGPAEAELGAAVARKAGLPRTADACGRLSLDQLAALMRTLDLCITPDTGPMHLADYLGVPVLNLSMGPVHARETGPRAPGQWVLRAAMSCVGCWQCRRGRLYCKAAFSPAVVAQTALALLEPPCAAAPAPLPPLSGLSLWRTGRDALGLHSLARLGPPAASCRPVLEDFWQAVFLHLYQPDLAPLLETRLATLGARFPALQARLAAAVAAVCGRCAAALKNPVRSLPPGFWNAQPPLARLGNGFLQMYLQNADYSRRAWNAALERLADLAHRLG